MKNSIPPKPAPGVTIQEGSPNAPNEPFFTPPIPPMAHPVVEDAGNSKKAEVAKTEEMPAQPHEHPESDPHSVGDSPGTEVIS